MKLLRRWLSLRFRLRARYWKRRALLAERRLEAEQLRNREREDELITVPMRAMGMFGMLPRKGPAPIQQLSPQAPKPMLTAPDSWGNLSWAEQQEFDLYWKPGVDGVRITEQRARQDFLAELQSRRMPLNDDPYGGTN